MLKHTAMIFTPILVFTILTLYISQNKYDGINEYLVLSVSEEVNTNLSQSYVTSFVMRSDGEMTHLIQADTGYSARGLVWSNDGTHYYQLASVQKQYRQITWLQHINIITGEIENFDDTDIPLLSDKSNYLAYPNSQLNYELYHQIVIENDQKSHLLESYVVVGDLTWIPDSNYLAFVGYIGSNQSYYPRDISQIQLLNADDLSVHQLTNSPTAKRILSISPDGQWIIFHDIVNETLEPQVWLISIDGQQLYKTPLGDDLIGYPNISWSPDSQTIFYARTPKSNGTELGVLDLASLETETLLFLEFDQIVKDVIWSSDDLDTVYYDFEENNFVYIYRLNLTTHQSELIYRFGWYGDDASRGYRTFSLSPMPMTYQPWHPRRIVLVNTIFIGLIYGILYGWSRKFLRFTT